MLLVCAVYNVMYSESSNPEIVRNRTNVLINFLLRMTDTITSQNIDPFSWGTLYNQPTLCITDTGLQITEPVKKEF
jgi:hypothetical protein